MLKPKSYNFADSNIALLGSDIEKKVKKAASDKEPAWENAGKHEGVEIWRIVNFQVKPIEKNTYGEFYRGDSYIVLNTYKKNNALLWNVHFWLGSSTTADEAGTAAYKTVELDDKLGGGPVEFREVEGLETKTFLKLFPNMRLLEGGADSGFNHVQKEAYKPRLLHIKGTKQNVIAIEVPLKATSLNSGDSFILDLGMKVYSWIGSKSSISEKSKITQMARAIDDSRGSSVELVTLLEGDDNDDEFWKHLGGKQPVSSATQAEPDSTVNRGNYKLFRIHDNSFEQIASGNDVSLDKLKSDDVFFIETDLSGWIWVGSKASAEEKKLSLLKASDYLTKNGKGSLPLIRLYENADNDEFKALFA